MGRDLRLLRSRGAAHRPAIKDRVLRAASLAERVSVLWELCEGWACVAVAGVAMQVIMVSRFGDPDVLEVGEADLPRPRSGEALVRVLAAGVGPWDVTLRRGGWTGSLPYVPGGEFAGVVEGDSGDEAGLHDGAPVYGYPGLT